MASSDKRAVVNSTKKTVKRAVTDRSGGAKKAAPKLGAQRKTASSSLQKKAVMKKPEKTTKETASTNKSNKLAAQKRPKYDIKELKKKWDKDRVERKTEKAKRTGLRSGTRKNRTEARKKTASGNKPRFPKIGLFGGGKRYKASTSRKRR